MKDVGYLIRDLDIIRVILENSKDAVDADFIRIDRLQKFILSDLNNGVRERVREALQETKSFIENMPKGIGRGAASPLYMQVTTALALLAGDDQ